jgi:hypothetical protein
MEGNFAGVNLAIDLKIIREILWEQTEVLNATKSLVDTLTILERDAAIAITYDEQFGDHQ